MHAIFVISFVVCYRY